MRLKFKTIRYKNFLQTGNEFATFKLDQHPFTVIVGKNGSGKSTLLDALSYVNYGKPYRTDFTLKQLINNTNRKQMLVEQAFEVDGVNYVVRRGEKPKIFEIYKEKVLIPFTSASEYQALLESILGQNHKTFFQINVLGKASYKQFMSLSAPERRKVVEDILGSAIFTTMSDLGKADLKVLNSDLLTVQRGLDVLRTKKDSVESMLARYNEDRRADIEAQQIKLKQLQKEVEAIDLLIDERRSAAVKYKNERDEFLSIERLTLVENKIDEIKSQNDITKHSIRTAQSLIDKIETLEVCAHCQQEVDDNHKQEIVDTQNDIIHDGRKTLEANKISLEKLENIIIKYREIDSKLQEEIEAAKEQTRRRQQIISNIDLVNDRIEQLKRPVKLPDDINLEEINEAIIAEEIKESDLIKRVGLLKEAIKHLGDDGIKAKLVNKYIPLINKSINDYLERMDMFVEFTLDSEFKETINAINRDLFTINSFSEGQKVRIDLAILMTWRHIASLRNSASTNLFILDEVMDGSLDEEGTAEFIQILRGIADTQNTIVISHKDSTIDLFDNAIRAVTEGNYTAYYEI